MNRSSVPTPREQRVIALRIHRGDEPSFLLPLEDARTTLLIGRGEQADVRLRDDRVSRMHGMLRCDGDDWFYVDLGSANGSFFLEKQAEGAALNDDDARRLAPGDAVPLSITGAILVGRRNLRIEPLVSMPESVLNRGTHSAAGRRFEEALNAVAPSSLPVFLLGPSGAGKTWAAKVLHERSGRRGRFIAINCARLAGESTQLQSELLGHKKGAFTDARVDRVGHFFEADQGTLFLDEVESLSPLAQGFLLDLLESSGLLLPLGAAASEVPKRPKVRIVSASKAPLQQSMLRADLAHRLAAGELITVPTLSERKADIPGLVETFLDQEGESTVVVSPAAMDALCSARWRGEVRELRASVETLADRARRRTRPVIDVEDVTERLRALAEAHGGPPEPAKSGARPGAFDPEQTGEFRRYPAPTHVDGQPVVQPPPQPSVVLSSRHATKEQIERALEQNGWNIDQTARALHWARNTLTTRMDGHGIPRRNPK